jgi:hypothetical protein
MQPMKHDPRNRREQDGFVYTDAQYRLDHASDSIGSSSGFDILRDSGVLEKAAQIIYEKLKQ